MVAPLTRFADMRLYDPRITPSATMPKITPKPSITAKGVESALRKAVDGQDGEIKDGACRGLSLRFRDGKVNWSIRWKLGDTCRRWSLGDHQVLPDEARRRA